MTRAFTLCSVYANSPTKATIQTKHASYDVRVRWTAGMPFAEPSHETLAQLEVAGLSDFEVNTLLTRCEQEANKQWR